MDLDSLDRAIVAVLMKDARTSLREVARRVGSTAPTVTTRIRRLEDLGVLTGYGARVDEALLPDPRFRILVIPAKGEEEIFVEAILRLDGVAEVERLEDGRVTARLVAKSDDDGETVALRIARLPGADRVQVSAIVPLKQGRRAGPPPAVEELPEALAVACHACGGPIHGEGIRSILEGHAHVYCCATCEREHREHYVRLRSEAPRR